MGSGESDGIGKNILKPATGAPVTTPQQDIALRLLLSDQV